MTNYLLKFFEKLILKQIHYLETTNKLDLKGKRQHGFKRNKSAATAGALLQSVISQAADDKCYVVMASLDLSLAFDMVNTSLLVKQLRLFPSWGLVYSKPHKQKLGWQKVPRVPEISVKFYISEYHAILFE